MSDLQKYTEKLEKLEKKQKYLDKCNKLTFGTYTKRLVALIIGFCLFNVELSYVLSIFGKDPLIDVTEINSRLDSVKELKQTLDSIRKKFQEWEIK